MEIRDTGKRNIQNREVVSVAHVLEGSVRRLADRIAVNVQWSTRTPTANLGGALRSEDGDAVGIDGELATEIAQALRTR